MAISRTIKCDVCGLTAVEEVPMQGWPGWGALQGVILNGVENPNLCPLHLGHTANFVDSMVAVPVKE